MNDLRQPWPARHSKFALVLEKEGRQNRVVFVYAATIFIGAFLLFLVQPLIGKYILPWFGGAPAVWTVCMLFFQMLLLGGYAYAHFTSRWLKPRRQAIVHLVLLVAAVALLPINPADSWKPDGTGNPTWQILQLLAVSIGLPYFVISSTGPLMQHWFSRTHPGVSPFRLYALSNVGSLLALISFPIFFETQFTRKAQASLWGWGLIAYVIASGLCAVKLWRTSSSSKTIPADDANLRAAAPPPVLAQKILWLLLPACASVLLLAITNKICQDVAVIPFLWVLPLSLYLLSFVICFDNPRWYRRGPFILALTSAWGALCWVLFTEATSIQWPLIIYSAALFICCIVCHGELYRLKPDPRYLTSFYLMIAAGGALGGLFVTVFAPLIFTDYFELQWGFLLCGLLLLLVCLRDRHPGRFQRWRLPACALLSAALLALGMILWSQAHQADNRTVFRSRNFYGVLTVSEEADKPGLNYRKLNHGVTLHGLQFLDPLRADWPTSYYGKESGVGLAFDALPSGHRRVGLVGLGVGTLAAYARPGDDFSIYEINPEVQRLATSRFTYLARCAGKIAVKLGDGRLSLEREPAQHFDLLVLDAFSGDAVPTHLLTWEAFAIYKRHLKTNGIIAIHITNRYLDLEPVIIPLARELNCQLAIVDLAKSDPDRGVSVCVWVLLAQNKETLDSPAIRQAARPPQVDPAKVPLWTDDFASLFQIVRSDELQLDPELTQPHIRVALDLCQRGDIAGAMAHYQLAIKRRPNAPELLNNLAWLLATCPQASLRNGPEAVRNAERACRLMHYTSTLLVGTLAAAYAEAGQFAEAVAMAEKACRLASESGERGLLQKNQELLTLYRAGQPYHESAGP